ncbi:hypothetical protein EJ06DRAFT_469925 [Trichodelitschia bisporula]|uniref:Pathogen-related protein n=1 Tax=Trichodelitschia bisporula TaxID=703511 RepID=A0A6G1I7U0_9PEZI|nr:hypothetical protein EJ06DRAFT_469925 [Trichodelitschia bisporula]
MVETDILETTSQLTRGLSDIVTDPNAVLKDITAEWRYGQPPDYSKTRVVYAQSKKMNHEAGSLPNLVENLVKNWEVEASFKTKVSEMRTIDPEHYSFAVNGGPPQAGEHVLKIGTYNALIAPNEYYSPENSDFNTSHKTFKRMMPTFAWEVLEVYSGPPKVAFKWRHWGTMKNDYVGFNNKGEKVTAKAHGGLIEIHGVTIAEVDERFRVRKLETWFDPLDMFRQIAPQGVVAKEPIAPTTVPEAEIPPPIGPATEKPRRRSNSPTSIFQRIAGVLYSRTPPAEAAPATGTVGPKTGSASASTGSRFYRSASRAKKTSASTEPESVVPTVAENSIPAFAAGAPEDNAGEGIALPEGHVDVTGEGGLCPFMPAESKAQDLNRG